MARPGGGQLKLRVAQRKKASIGHGSIDRVLFISIDSDLFVSTYRDLLIGWEVWVYYYDYYDYYYRRIRRDKIR